MSFKLRKDASAEFPLLVCDVCDQAVSDLWGDKATGSPTNGQTVDVTIHHAACTPPAGSVTMPLIDFLRLFTIRNRVGDVGTDHVTEKACVEYPDGKGFEA